MVPPRRTVMAGAAAAAVLALAGCGRAPASNAAAATSAIGGPFTLVDQSGRVVTDRDFKGRPSVFYFGFTYCPEACPTTLAAMTGWIKTLGPEADRLNFAFVSIDPERDTPAQIARYLSAFDPRIRGLTGTTAQVAQVAGAYRVFYRKVPLDGGGYTMDHSTVVYLMRADGQSDSVIGYQEPPDQAVAQLRGLLRSG